MIKDNQTNKECKLILDHDVNWAGDGYFCSKCMLQFIPKDEELATNKDKDWKKEFDKRFGERTEVWADHKSIGKNIKQFIETLLKTQVEENKSKVRCCGFIHS